MARNAPASVAVATAIAVALAYTDDRRDADERGGVGVLRRGPHLPTERRALQTQLQTRRGRATATPGRAARCTGTEIWPLMAQLLVETPPAVAPSERTSGEKICSSPFWMTIDRPKVVSSGTSGPPTQAAREHGRAAARSRRRSMTGSAGRRARNGEMCSLES